jgi:hypothetical protein
MILKHGGVMLKISGILTLYLEGFEIKMMNTWLVYTSLPTIRVGLVEDYISLTPSLKTS